MGGKRLASLLALAAVAGAPAGAQELIGVPAPTLGMDFKPRAQQIIDEADANEHFEAVSDTRFVSVRHKPSGFTCTFMPFSRAMIYVMNQGDIAGGDDILCVEIQGDAIMEFRVSRFGDVAIDELFASARSNANDDFDSAAREVAGAELMPESPAPPHVALDMPRRHALLVGDVEGQPAMLQVALAQLPDGWFLGQRYSVLLPVADSGQLDDWAREGSELAQAILALKLGELEAPAPDPALAAR